MASPALPARSAQHWPRDWITWAACVVGLVMVGAYVTVLLIFRFELLALFAGAAAGLSLAPMLGARRSKHASGAALAVFLISFGHPVWLFFLLVSVVFPLWTQIVGVAPSRPSEALFMLAITAACYALLLGIAAQSWKVALAILACGAASIMVDYTFPTMDSAPSIATLCLGVVIAPAIDTLARAGITLAAHACPRCNYDLSGLHSPTCPECGNTIPTSPPLFDSPNG